MAARYIRRIRAIRRGAAGTAVAALAVAALSASQAPGFAQAERARNAVPKPPPGPQIDGGSPFYSALPPEDPSGLAVGGTSAPTPTGGTGAGVDTGGTGLPGTVLDAYRRAQLAIATSDAGCRLPWELLAAIGQVESGQAGGGAVDAQGTTYKPILGPVLDGVGFANISDSDGGAYDGDTVHDRAVGPMQFIPSTWASWGADGNADGVKNPNNIYDAALAAGHYLCADNRDLSVSADIDRAILGYNHSQDYLHTVRAWFQHFKEQGAVAVPDSGRAPVTGPRSRPPATPGAKPGTGPSPTVTGSPSPSPSATVPSAPPTTRPGTPTTTPSATSSPSPKPTPTPTPTGTPTPGCPTPTPTPSGSASPSPTPTGTPTPTPTPTDGSCPTPTPSTSPTPTPTTAAASPSAAPSTSPAPAAG
ncbi:lytic transglycosylase domain-containing protein [Streptomyces sp. H39-S7]|uniref:lytic transglycosylase domain-containing protein n=1 Tax=Streptomyces sp. H39-S7 TaxID=3004357 RepID=UPI0022AFAB2E|nr:hypothetical protein [Streptomyces sp. H39-S7]MCZ4121209.1 hypothetical protein [Streptomyces sp. H39-S7]